MARVLHIFDARRPATAIGGLLEFGNTTNADFLFMLGIWIEDEKNKEGPLIVQLESGIKIESDDTPLQPGNYYVDARNGIRISTEVSILRTQSTGVTGKRTGKFVHDVRQRDQRCIITKRPVNLKLGPKYAYVTFHVAHVYPIAREKEWKEEEWDKYLTTDTNTTHGSINSVQNGILLDVSTHMSFDAGRITINPDDGHKVIAFAGDDLGVSGNRLDRQFLDDPMRPPDQLFRWHFRQAVLRHMKGPEEVEQEYDLEPGSDMISEIFEGPSPGARMEAELFTRLAVDYDLTVGA